MKIERGALTVRPEEPRDHRAVFDVNERAFETSAEAKLVNVLRPVAQPLISLVALLKDRIVGHILFTPVTVEGAASGLITMGLAPMAVLPDVHRCGIGSMLVRAGLDACRALSADAVFVLGHAAYYPRFGFEPAAPYGLRYKSERFDPYFMVLELRRGVLGAVHGLVDYHPVFDAV